jgi:predicted DNA-binding antitoxin AbrB/MazE fold protein
MEQVIKAIYQQGVLRPLETLDLPDGCELQIAIRVPDQRMDESALAKLGRSFVGIGSSGRRDISERAEELLRAGFAR